MNILVLCTGNSCRSQMAEGYLRHFCGEKASIYSAGIEAHGVNPNAVAAMAEDGIDISRQTSDLIDAYENIPMDVVITVCDNAREVCPFFPTNARKLHHNFPDPARASGTPGQVRAEFRRVRDMIKEYCRGFAATHVT